MPGASGMSVRSVAGIGVWMRLHTHGGSYLMKYGASGETVRRLQRALNAVSPDTVKVTGQGNDLSLDLNSLYTTATPGAYPIALATYEIVCTKYSDPQTGQAVKAFLRAFTKGTKDVIADPKAAIATLKARDGLVNEELELRRLKLALDATVLTADAKAEGFGEVRGPRLSLMASQVSDAFATKDRVSAAAVWKDGFLPAAADRDIFKAAKK